MSSNCPPQLHLSLPASTTSFKRSFEQFGFDLDSPLSSATEQGGTSNNNASTGDGNDRNKRARSESRLSNVSGELTDVSSGASSSSASSSDSSTLSGSDTDGDNTSDLYTTSNVLGGLSMAMVHGPPRLPTPVLEDSDIEMPDYSPLSTGTVASSTIDDRRSESPTISSGSVSSPENQETYRLSLERFNVFDTQISALRSSPPSLPPINLPPVFSAPILPSMNPPDRQDDLETFPSTQSSDAEESYYAERDADQRRETPSQDADEPSPTSHIDFSPPIWPRLSDPRTNASATFRERLNSALDLRSTSPLLPDLVQESATTIPSMRLQRDLDDVELPHIREPSTAASARAGLSSIREALGHMSPDHYNPPWLERSSGSVDGSSSSRDTRWLPLPPRRMPPREAPAPALTPVQQHPTSSTEAAYYSTPLRSHRGSSESWPWGDSEVSDMFARFLDTVPRPHNTPQRRPTSYNGDLDDGLFTTQEPDVAPISDPRIAPGTRVPPPPLPPWSSDLSHHDFARHDRDTSDPDNYRRPWRVANGTSRSTFADRMTSYTPVESRGQSNEAAPSRRPLPSTRMRSSSPFLGSSMWSDLPSFTLFDDEESPYTTTSRNSRVSPNDDDVRSLESRFTDPISHLGSDTSYPTPGLVPSLHRLRSRMYGTRLGGTNSLVSESAAEIRRRNARLELMERLSNEDSEQIMDTNDSGLNTNVPRSIPTAPLNLRSSHMHRPNQVIPDHLFYTRQTEAGTSSMRTRTIGTLTESSSSDHPRNDHTISSPHHAPTTNTTATSAGSQIHRRQWDPLSEAIRRNGPVRPPSPPSFANRYLNHISSLSDEFDSRFSSVSDMPDFSADLSDRRRQRGELLLPPRRPTLPRPDLGVQFSYEDRVESAFNAVTENLNARAALRTSIGESRAGFRTAFRSPSPGERNPSPMSLDRELRRPHDSSSTINDNTQPSSGTYGALDPSSYHPGPFRNTIQRLVDMERMRTGLATGRADSIRGPPPSLPPLRFEDDFASLQNAPVPESQSSSGPSDDNYNYWARFMSEDRQTSDQRSRGPYIHPSLSEETTARQLRSRDPDASEDSSREGPLPRRRPYVSTTAPRRSSPGLRPARSAGRSSDADVRRTPNDIHSYLTRQARMEASRLDRLGLGENSSQSDAEGLSHALDVLRHDGLSIARSQQMINRYQRERIEADARRAASQAWGSIDQRPTGPTHGLRSRAPSRDVWPEMSPMPHPSAGTSENARPSTSGSPTRDLDSAYERMAARTRARAGRFRYHHPDAPTSLFGHSHDFLSSRRRMRNAGDYMRDEDFDESYESLVSLAATLGDAKPRATPDHVITSLPTGLYKDWATPDSDERCPICLEDYKSSDTLLKLPDCSHWLHKGCLEQWLRGANTCPVCRKGVKGSQPARRCPHFSGPIPGPSWRRDNENEGNGGGGGGSGSGSSGWPVHDWPARAPWR